MTDDRATSGPVRVARRAREAGQLWKARDVLLLHVEGAQDPEALLELGEVLFEMGDLPRAGAVSPAAGSDLTEQLGTLVFPGFLAATAYPHLVDLPRFLQAARLRVDTLLATPARDAAPLETVLRCEDAYAELCAAAPPGRPAVR